MCRKMLIAQLKSLTMSKAPSRARSPLSHSEGACWQLKVRFASVWFGFGFGFWFGFALLSLCCRGSVDKSAQLKHNFLLFGKALKMMLPQRDRHLLLALPLPLPQTLPLFCHYTLSLSLLLALPLSLSLATATAVAQVCCRMTSACFVASIELLISD